MPTNESVTEDMGWALLRAVIALTLVGSRGMGVRRRKMFGRDARLLGSSAWSRARACALDRVRESAARGAGASGERRVGDVSSDSVSKTLLVVARAVLW